MNNWVLFFLAAGAAALLLYVPGFCFLKACKAKTQPALVLAPVFSLLFLVLLGLVFYQVGISFEMSSLLIALTLACFLCGAAAALSHGNHSQDLFADWDIPWTYVALYLLIGILVCGFVFVLPLDGAESFSDSYDNAFHLSVVKSFYDSKTASTLHVSAFPDKIYKAAFYPAAWHVLTTGVACITNVKVALAANAVNAVICAIVVPLGWLGLLSSIFKSERKIVLIGSFACIAFNAFPWGFLIWGQILPNLLAFALIPAGVAIFSELIGCNASSKVKLILLAIFVFSSIAFAQPNGVFTLGIAILPMLTKWVMSFVDFHAQSNQHLKKLVAVTVFYVFVAAIWYACYKAPFMQATVQYEWETDNTLSDAMLNGLGFSFGPIQEPQYFLAALVIVGIVVALLRRDYLGKALVTLFFAASLLQVIAATNYGVVKHMLTGFWYTDYYRVGAMQVMAAIPLVCLGIKQILEVLSNLIRNTYFKAACVFVCIVAFGFIVYRSSGAFGYTRSQIAREYNYNCDFGLDSEEKTFIEEVKEIVGDSAVLNMPFDGSRFLYATYDLNVLYRTSNLGSMSIVLDEPLEDSALIPMHLKDIATDTEVAELVNELDAKYVLLLDASWPSEGSVDSILYDSDLWIGIQGINEDTRGFELVLEQGDMRLYWINV